VAVTVEIEDDTVYVRMHDRDVFWALKRTVAVPLRRIERVEVVETRRLRGRLLLRFPGTFVPGVIKAGSYGLPGRWEFWCVHRARWVLAIECYPGAYYDLVAVETDDPHEDALRIRAALRRWTSVR
jgi:hypothetical protein